MKKFICAVSMMIGLCSFANAQTAYESAKVFDNTSVGITAGISSPLDFNSVTPFNTNVGIKLQKDFTPIVGVQVEGLAFVNANHFNNLNTFVKATNVSASGVVNWSNALLGYKGTPRFFEVSSVTGLGWLYMWDTPNNTLSAKTGLDLFFNLGKKKAHSIVLTPAVYWNLSNTNKVQFNKNHAQLAVNASYIYHFKTSNGTHSFKKYDIGAMNDEINSLKEELTKKPTEIIREVTTSTVNVVDNSYTVTFAKGSSEVSDVTAIANALKQTDKKITIVGGVSPEGSESFNKALALKRAQAVKDALVKAGIDVNRMTVTSDYTAQRRATIVVEK
jgi:outer membrane protein OmpA-like peptidoglycan-associated protein